MTDFLPLAKEDPLCAAEGLDLESASGALDALEAEVRALQGELVKESLRKRAYFFFNPIARSAVPLRFMRALIKSEASRRAYLAEQTAAHERALKRAWIDAARAYAQDVAAFHRLFNIVLATEPQLKHKLLNDMAGNSFTAADIEADLSRFEENAGVLLREARERASGRGQLLKDPRPAPQAEPAEAVAEPYRWIEEFEDERFEKRFELAERHGPIALKLSHFDGAPAVRQFIAYFGRNKKTAAPYAWVHARDKMSFLQIIGGTGLGRLTPTIFLPLIERGIPYFGQFLTSFYALRDQQYQADVLTLIDRTRRPELSAVLLNAQRSSLFDALVWGGADEIKRFIQMVRVRAHAGDKGYSMGYSFLTYSNASIYFMPFNHSVWRLAPISLIGSGRTPEAQRIYRTLEELPPMGRQELKDIVTAGGYRRKVWEAQGLVLGE